MEHEPSRSVLSFHAPGDPSAGGVLLYALQNAARAAARERELARADAERDRQAAEIDFLREQLAARTQAEEQFCMMLARPESTNAELAAALVTKALPPAPVRRVRWWPLWRRG